MATSTDLHQLELPDHETLARLASDDPAAYEALRSQLIDTLIATAPERIRPRLLGVQFRIDGIRKLSHSGLGATVKIYQLMWETFLQMNDDWQAFMHLKNGDGAAVQSATPMRRHSAASARVIAFPGRYQAK